MPMMLGSKGKDILQWRASEQLVNTLKERLDRKVGDSPVPEATSFLGRLIASLEEEISFEGEFLRESAALDEAIDAAASPEELEPLSVRYRELLSAHFGRRQSVLVFFKSCNALHDRILARAVAFAKERMRQGGQGDPPLHALLVSGDRGRGEQTLFGKNRYLLLHEEESPRFFLFSHQLSAALRETGLLTGEQMFWHGSLAQWRAVLRESLSLRESGGQKTTLAPFSAPLGQGPRELPEWEWRLEAIADLLGAAGDPDLSAQALESAARTLKEERNRAPFQQLARRVIGLPLAFGRFGRWRLQREGEHRGELNLEEFALGPLTMTIRILAVNAGIALAGSGTADRLQELLEKSALDVGLAERLLKGYQCLMQLRIASEIRDEDGVAFCNPEEFTLAEEERFRGALEAVLNLQRIAYQRMVGQG